MKFAESFIIALRSLTANKLRSSLTMLGIIIGVGAVITLVSVGRGAQASITATFEGLGTNVVYVQPQNPDAPGFAALSPGYAEQTLTLADTDALAEIPGVVGIAPTNENFVEVVAGTENVFVVIHGSTAAYLEAYGHQLGWGQFITERNVKARDMVVVLGSKVANDLFGLADPVGQTVKIKDKRFTVIGVLAPKGGS
ncbi:MAG: ABC transporter permease, partial [Chloroflexota bacterium]